MTARKPTKAQAKLLSTLAMGHGIYQGSECNDDGTYRWISYAPQRRFPVLHSTVKAMERSGWIAVRSEQGWPIWYSITPEGREAYDAHRQVTALTPASSGAEDALGGAG